MINKFGEDMPETAEEIRERLSELKHELMMLRNQNADISEYEGVRNQALRLEEWRKHLVEIGQIEWQD